MGTPFKMKGFSGFGNSPAKDVNKSRKIADENKPDTSVKRSNYRAELKTIKPTTKRNTKPVSPSTPFTPPPASNNKNKGTVKGITNFEYDFPKTNKVIDSHNKVIKKGINTVKNTGKKIKDYFTKK